MLKERAVEQSPWFEERSREPAWLALLDKVWRITGFAKMNPCKPPAERISHFQSLAQQIGIERAHGMELFHNEVPINAPGAPAQPPPSPGSLDPKAGESLDEEDEVA